MCEDTSPSINYTAQDSHPIGPTNAALTPRYAGTATFAKLPRTDEVNRTDVAVLGVPFDAGASYRPGARFGPSHVREASRLLRPFNQELRMEPFAQVQVADAGDVPANPFDIQAAIREIQSASAAITATGSRIVAIGGDHTIALPLLRTATQVHGPAALLHFDAHLDTWDTYFGADYTHGTPFRRAAEEGLLDAQALYHVGTRGPLYSETDLSEDREFGFEIIGSDQVAQIGPRGVAEQLLKRVGERPLYISVDIDVLDPAHAPGTGTPEAGGLSSRELLTIIQGLAGLNIVGADVVEVSPPYDHGDITAVAAARVVYDLISLVAMVTR